MMNNHAPNSWKSSWALAVASLLCFSLVYEPTRQVLVHSQTLFNFSGVGGVGGLANLGAPETRHFCHDDSQNFSPHYCYEKGSLGPFTVMQIGTVILWVGPCVVACLVVWLRNRNLPNTNTTTRSNAGAIPATGPLGEPMPWLQPLWAVCNMMWFLLPLVGFGTGMTEMHLQWPTKTILVIALAASHPLSWNLALVAIPTGGIITRLVLEAGEQQDATTAKIKELWFPAHRLLGYTTAFWGTIHGLGQLLYLCSSVERFKTSFTNVFHDGEVLLYWLGFGTLTTLLFHSIRAYYRRHHNKVDFLRWHKAGATLLLLLASSHWWPFAFFLLPATTIVAVQWTMPAVCEDVSKPQIAGLLGVALISGLGLGLVPVWVLRESYMMSSGANLYVPFLFPPLAVTASMLASMGSTKLLSYWQSVRPRSQNTTHDEATVESENEDHEPAVTAETPLLSTDDV